MPLDKKQHTTLTPNPTTAESSSPQEGVQQAFHHHLREQIRCAVQVVMEEIMREELTQSSSRMPSRILCKGKVVKGLRQSRYFPEKVEYAALS